MRFSVALGPITKGKGNYNASSIRGVRVPGTSDGTKLSETSYKQTEAEHKALLDSYMNDPTLTPDQKIQFGIEEEKRCPRYWDNDDTPRYGGTTPSSSFIQEVMVNPSIGTATVTMKSGKSYTYPLGTDRTAEMINSNSIGSWYNKNVKHTNTREPVVSSPRTGSIALSARGSSNASGLGAPSGYRIPMNNLSPAGLSGSVMNALFNVLGGDMNRLNSVLKIFGSKK